MGNEAAAPFSFILSKFCRFLPNFFSASLVTLCGVQCRDIQATDNPENFPGNPLALLNLDTVGRLQRITDCTH
jgi:hypothetical protein